MSVDRLSKHIDLTKTGLYLFIYGNVTDQFITNDLSIHSLDRLLWLYLQKNDFKRIVFFDSSNRLRCFDSDSFDLARGVSAKKREVITVGDDFDFEDDSPLSNGREYLGNNGTETTAAPTTNEPQGVSEDSSIYSLPYTDLNAIAKIESWLADDSIKTAVVFSQLDQHYFDSNIAVSELMNRFPKWINYRNNNKCILVFQSESLFTSNNGNKLWIPFLQNQNTLRNVIESKTPNILNLNQPGKDEINALFQRLRLFDEIRLDWLNIERMVKGMLKKKKLIRDWNIELIQENQRSGGLDYQNFVLNGLIDKTYSKEEENTLDEKLLKGNLGKIKCQEENSKIVFSLVKSFFYRKNKKRPLVFYFVGTSGTGKTFTSKQLGNSLKRNGYKYVYFAMPEFQQEHTVSKIIGSPPGYVGSTAKPKLLKEYEESKKMVICFDEIEKAHPRILTALMQLLDEGKVTFNVNGESITADFKESIICFTSNAQMMKLLKLKKEFSSKGIKSDNVSFQRKVGQVLVDAKVIRTEVTGRVNQFLVYNPFTPEGVMDIVMQELNMLQEGVKVVKTPPKLLAEIALHVSGSLTGARDIKKELESRFGEDFSQTEKGEYILKIKDEEYELAPFSHGLIEIDDIKNKKEAIKLFHDLELKNRLVNFDNLKEHLLSEIKGQDENIEQIILRLQTWYPLKEKNKPLSFFSIGTSGTGKTFTAKLLAKSLSDFGFSGELVYFDMNNFNSTVDRDRLVGPPPGVMGSSEKPKIFDELDNSSNGKLVICFDEIEKAHPDILTSLMQLLDEGFLEWSKGSGDFRKCIIFFTSNAQMETLDKLKKSWRQKRLDVKGRDFEEKVRNVLVENNVIRTEVAGRISKFLIYNSLGLEETLKIACKEIDRFAKGYGFEKVTYISPSILSETAKVTSGKNTGIRDLRAFLEENIGPFLVDFLRKAPNAKNISILNTINKDENPNS